MHLLLLILACASEPTTDDEPVVEPAAAHAYIDGMWAQRALTVRSGLEEAAAFMEGGDNDEAAAHVMRVYHGAFEPELEPLIRGYLDTRQATELEYRFGLLRVAYEDKARARVDEEAEGLLTLLDACAAQLDAEQAVLNL